MEKDEEEYSFVDVLKSTAKTHLFNDLDKFDGDKLFVWEKECMICVDLLVSCKIFNAHNVKHVELPKKPDDLKGYLSEKIKHIFYIIPPSRKFMEEFLKCLEIKFSVSYAYHVRVLTRIPKLLQEFFDNNKSVKTRHPTIQAWPFYWAPTFGDFVLNNFNFTGSSRLLLASDFEQFFLCACALNDIFTAKNFYWHGSWAQEVMDNLRSLKQSVNESAFVFDEIIVVDRLIDPVTPLLEQFSFSGILDTIFGINTKGDIEVHEEMLNRKLPLAESRQGLINKIQLDTDAYKNLIHLSMNDAITQIRISLRELSDAQKAQEKLTSANELKQYMPMLHKLVNSKVTTSQALTLVSIGYCFHAQPEQFAQIQCEKGILNGEFSQSKVIDFIEELIIDGSNAIIALRLIALQSLVYGGLTSRVWDEYQKLLVQSFGPPAVAWCLNLQFCGFVSIPRAQLVHSSKIAAQFSQIGNELKRMECVKDKDPLASFYSGYVPLIVRQLDQKMQENWKGFDKWNNDRLKKTSVASNTSPKRALFVIGGLTRSEIACIRAMRHRFEFVFTTSILKQGDLIDFTSVL